LDFPVSVQLVNFVNTKNHHFEIDRLAQTRRANCGLHPLIHTRLEFNLAQDIEGCQGGEKKAPIGWA